MALKVHVLGSANLIFSELLNTPVSLLIVIVNVPIAPAVVYCGINVLVVAPRVANVMAGNVADCVLSLRTSAGVRV